MKNNKKAFINATETEFDLSGRSKDSYDYMGDRVSYIGEGAMIVNQNNEETSGPTRPVTQQEDPEAFSRGETTPVLKHFFTINN